MINFTIPLKGSRWKEYLVATLLFSLIGISVFFFVYYYRNGLGLAYNDARSHLDIGRRVVEGLKPGLAQIGSVWLPLPHILMIPTIWNDFMWHSGLAGAIQNMISFVVLGVLIYRFLGLYKVGLLGRITGILLFVANLNILFLQSTAMTELLLLSTMLAGMYYLLKWHQKEEITILIKSAFWIMMSSLVRYEGWFLLFYASVLIVFTTWRKKGYKVSEGTYILFATLAAFGIALWFLWNGLIFKDPFYFAFGPFSAHSQQAQLQSAGVLATKGNLTLSLKVYLYALLYNTYTFPVVLALIGTLVLLFDKTLSKTTKLVSSVLYAPFIFNVLALYLGHSVLFIQGISGDTWFNVRYGIMMMPSIAILIGFLIDRAKAFRLVIIGLLFMVLFFAFGNNDAVTIDDARVGSSQKNVSEVSGWIYRNAKDKPGFILISAASHDAIIFSSGLPMKKFIHEGTGAYWDSATTSPDRWARWIIMRTNDINDLTWKSVSNTPGFSRYDLVEKYPFADIYQIKPEFVSNLNTEPILGKQR